MKKFIPLFFILILLPPPSVWAQQPRQLVHDGPGPGGRLALVIGNGTYNNAPPLRNPANDATDMAAVLSKLGFKVENGVNLKLSEMKAMIREFGRKLRGGGQGLFYFAGHGVQLRGRNYLIPVDADIQTETDIEDQGVDANLVLGLMDEANNGFNVVILDACRNNPFARSFRSTSNGLAQMDAPSGTLIAYATAPGSVASDGTLRNGLYTQELLKFVREPGLSIEEVFKRVRISVRNLTKGKQTPWESSSLTGDFYFAGTAQGQGAARPGNETASAQPVPLKPSLPTPNESDSIAGTYIDTTNDGSYIELKSDGSFFFAQVFPTSVYKSVGKYEIEGTQITIIFPTGQADRGTMNKNTIRSDDGKVYIKASPGTAIPTPKFSNQTIQISRISFLASPYEARVPATLLISGMGWDGASDIKVKLNGQDISKQIVSQIQYLIQLKGTVRELNMLDGKNELVVIVNGTVSNTYTFKQAVR